MGEIVVLTGAAGFLGHHTLLLLLSRDDKVAQIRCLDRAQPSQAKRRQLEAERRQLEARGGPAKTVRWFQGDVRDVNLVEQVLEGAHCVLHCAAKVDVWRQTGDQDAAELLDINVAATELLLRACVRLAVRKFVHVSSFECYASYETIYYATENTLPETKWHLFGPSGATKQQAEAKVKLYAGKKLAKRPSSAQDNGDSHDALNAIIVRLPQLYGEFDSYYVSKIIELADFFGGTLRRLNNVWICQQPLYVVNAAWSLIKAKDRMEFDQSTSGEEFHITDETAIGDPFDFVEPFLEARGMRVTKSSYPFLPIFLLVWLFFLAKRLLKQLDVCGFFSSKPSRLAQAIELDRQKELERASDDASLLHNNGHYKTTSHHRKRWFHYVMPQTLGFMCNTSFLNRTKANLRLGYEPLIEPDEAIRRSLDWYKNHLVLESER